jgi:hypothetical protein
MQVETQVTRIIPRPSPGVPLSYNILGVARELEGLQLDTTPLRQVARQLDQVTGAILLAQQKGDDRALRRLLREAVDLMRETITLLKMISLIERTRLPAYALDHLLLIRQIAGQMQEEMVSLQKVYSN